AEEAHQVFQRPSSPETATSIFIETYHELPPVPGHEALLAKWANIRAIRAEVLKQIEEKREAGKIGSSLQAEVDLHLHGERHAVLATLGDELRFVTITSRATLHAAANPESQRIEVVPSPHQKCVRCWHWRPEVGSHNTHPALCSRCIDNLFGAGETRRFV